ncbi:MAG: GNAT family N-acetyltransferase [Clostridia bacterium]|nr:GNAT family N-acetyltransferase [Clostridia bacterium]
MIKFVESSSMKVDVLKHQQKQISSLDKIEKVLEAKKALGFDIAMDNQTVGFAMVREYQNNKYFLWVYAIDKKFQGQGLGKKCLKEFLVFLKQNYGCTELSTTYKMGNTVAKNLYEGLGFQEIEKVEEEKEVDMILKL